jgi:hypothetical protein
MFAVETLTPLTTALAGGSAGGITGGVTGVTVSAVIASADPGVVVALVKKLFAIGAAMFVPLVKNVFGVEVTLVTTGVVVVVPFSKGTVSKGPTVPGLLGLVHNIVPPF